MSHKSIQKKLLLYLDGELPENERAMLDAHLGNCSLCSKDLEVLSKVWKLEGAVAKAQPSPYLWTRLETRIKVHERKQRLFAHMRERLIPLMRPVIVVVLFLLAIILGNYLGDLPPSNGAVAADTVAKEEVVKTFYLDAFEPFPPESIGKVLTIAPNGNGK